MTAGATQPRRARRWTFHLSALLLVLPAVYLPSYFRDMDLDRGVIGLGQRAVGPVRVGPWQLELAEWNEEGPQADPAGMFKTFSMALCEDCQDSIRAVFMRTGRPRDLRTAGALFSGGPHRAFAEVLVPPGTRPGDAFWITVEAWSGAIHQAAVPIARASPATAQWLRHHNGGTP